MPFMQKSFHEVVDSYTLINNTAMSNYPEYGIEVDGVKQYIKSLQIDTRYDPSIPTNIHVEGTSIFYNALKNILSLLDKDIISYQYNDEEFSFTFFDEVTLYLRTISSSNNSKYYNDDKYGNSIPTVYRKNQPLVDGYSAVRSLNQCKTYYSNGNSAGYPVNFALGSQSNIVINNNNKEFLFSICIRYNANYINVSYITATNKEIPVFLLMQGHTVDNKNIYFLTQGGGTFDQHIRIQYWYTHQINTPARSRGFYKKNTNNNSYDSGHGLGEWGSDVSSFAYGGWMNNPIFSLFTVDNNITGENNMNPFCFINNLYAMCKNKKDNVLLDNQPLNKAYPIAYQADGLVMTKPIWLNGYAEFDNIILAPNDLPDYNKNYDVNDETYWASGSYYEYVMRNWETLGYNTPNPPRNWSFYYMLKL